MKLMKYFALILFVVMGFGKVWASEETIIDPELMNKGVWSEPYFRTAGEAPRETASNGSTEELIDSDKMPEQYLDVQESIPTSESSVSRAWLEHKAMSAD